MGFSEEIAELAGGIASIKDHLKTEEATKMALVVPFLRALGYNPNDPREVVPEFTADVGAKKGEKVDYAILQKGHPVILIECKTLGADLSTTHAAQLSRYFQNTEAKFGLLTDGVVYRFFADLDKKNIMDNQPFLEVDLEDWAASRSDDLRRFTREAFDADQILGVAEGLKYTREIKRLLGELLAEPSEQFVKLIADTVFPGRVTAQVRERFGPLTRRAFQQFINDKFKDRLRSVTDPDEDISDDADTDAKSEIVTTEEEIEGVMIVRAILAELVDPTRVVMRDVQSYCGVLLDDNNRKPLVRLRFNAAQKYIGLFDHGKEEDRVPIDGVLDLYKFADRLRATPRLYD
jgi:predicted type IV restriction endonuclease